VYWIGHGLSYRVTARVSVSNCLWHSSRNSQD